MTKTLDERLNQILPLITSDAFLCGSGSGGELAFYVFDYPPQDELSVREHVTFLKHQIPMVKPSLRLAHVDLFSMVIEHLQERRLLDRALEMQKSKGDAAMLSKIVAPLSSERVAEVFVQKAKPKDHDAVLLTGVGSVWPLVRIHSLLSALHPLMGRTPLIAFYPGRYDGQYLRLFGKLKQNNYYRAFKLVP